MSQESLLLREIHRTCESCGAVAERNDQLHLCGCAEQMNCCADCSAKCANGNHKLIEPYYSEDGVTIYCGDCREILPCLFGRRFDLVLTDPPYNAKKDYGVFKDSLTAEAYAEMMQQIVSGCLQLSQNQFWVAPRYQMALWGSLLPSSHLIVIPRGAAGPFRQGWSDQFETALAVGKPIKIMPDLWTNIRLKGEGYFFREETYGHPGYTPKAIFERAIAAYKPASILDPFAGTGTSLVAAKQLGIKAVGIELNPVYCDIAIERLRQRVLNFEPPG